MKVYNTTQHNTTQHNTTRRINFSFLLLFFCSAFLFGQDRIKGTCPPSPPSGCTQVIEEVFDVDISAFIGSPGCTIPVKGKYCIIDHTHFTQIMFLGWDFDDDNLTGACLDAWNKKIMQYVTGASADNTLLLKDLYIYIGGAIIEKKATEFGNGLDEPTLAKYTCGFGVVKKTLSIHYYLGSCLTECIGVKKIGLELGKKNKVFIAKGDCSSNVCCYMSKSICFEEGSTVGNVSLFLNSQEFYPVTASSEICTPQEGGLYEKCGHNGVIWLISRGCAPVCEPTMSKVSAVLNNDVTPLFIEKVEGVEKFNAIVYPNPSSGFVNVAFDSAFNGVISLIDVSGRVILKENNTTASTRLDISKVPSGVYIIQFETALGTKVAEKISVRN